MPASPNLPSIDGSRRGEWLDAVYSDTTLITKVMPVPLSRELRPATGMGFTSSSTLPSLVLDMLEALDVADGHRVLEIGTGTGTGYNAALPLPYRDRHDARPGRLPGAPVRSPTALGPRRARRLILEHRRPAVLRTFRHHRHTPRPRDRRRISTRPNRPGIHIEEPVRLALPVVRSYAVAPVTA